MKIKDYKKVWLSWKLRYCDDRKALISSDFEIEELPEINYARVPFLWAAGLAEKYSWLYTLRNPSHMPENPWELTKFIKQVENNHKV